MKTSTLSGIIVCALAAMACVGNGYAEEVSGVVFNDLNGNGLYEIDESGIPKVCVSNGEEVVQTDAKGRYTLSLNDMGQVFVIKPSGWAIPVDPVTKAEKAITSIVRKVHRNSSLAALRQQATCRWESTFP